MLDTWLTEDDLPGQCLESSRSPSQASDEGKLKSPPRLSQEDPATAQDQLDPHPDHPDPISPQPDYPDPISPHPDSPALPESPPPALDQTPALQEKPSLMRAAEFWNSLVLGSLTPVHTSSEVGL